MATKLPTPRQPIRQIPKPAQAVKPPPKAAAAPLPPPKPVTAPKKPPKSAPEPANEPAPEPANEPILALPDDATFTMIPIEEITVIPDPHRTETEEEYQEAVMDLARSFKTVGILQPLVVNAVPDANYELIAGRRRIAAATVLGWTEVPCMVNNFDEVKAEMARLDENIIRSAYKKASYDKAMARWGALYESLYPETKQGAAGAAAVKAKRAAASGNKVASKPKRPTFTQTVAKKTGQSVRSVEKARKRGKTFTDADHAIFDQRKVGAHQQDTLAAISDPAKRSAVISAIGGGTPFQQAYDFVMLPPGSKVTTAGVDGATKAKTDEEWLSEMPIRNQVVKSRFDALALCYRRHTEVKLRVQSVFAGCRKEFGDLVTGKKNFMSLVYSFIKAPAPSTWKVCGVCQGHGAVKDDKGKLLPCDPCEGNGFVMK